MPSKSEKKRFVRRAFLVGFATTWFMFECFHIAFVNGFFVGARMLLVVATASRRNPVTVSKFTLFMAYFLFEDWKILHLF